MRALYRREKKCDLVSIDGSHIFEDVPIDAYSCIGLLRDADVVLFDDCTDRHIAKLISFIGSNLDHTTREVKVSKWRGDRGATAKCQIAKLLNRTLVVAF